jgi:hypothetical protein
VVIYGEGWSCESWSESLTRTFGYNYRLRRGRGWIPIFAIAFKETETVSSGGASLGSFRRGEYDPEAISAERTTTKEASGGSCGTSKGKDSRSTDEEAHEGVYTSSRCGGRITCRICGSLITESGQS